MVGLHVGLAYVGELGGVILFEGVDVRVEPKPWVAVIIALIVAAQEPGIPVDEVRVLQQRQQLLDVLNHSGLVVLLNRDLEF